MGEKNTVVIFFIKTLKFSKFVADISIAKEIQDSKNFSGIFQPRIRQLSDTNDYF